MNLHIFYYRSWQTHWGGKRKRWQTMAKVNEQDFCINCRKETAYKLQQKSLKKIIRGKEYEFHIQEAICCECGEQVCPPGLLDKNSKAIDEQYRCYENLVQIEEIHKCMALYDLRKETLSKALGFGEITIPRYLKGQMPSKEYSDRIRSVLHSYAIMEELLESNHKLLTDTAYSKVKNKINEIKSDFSSITPKLSSVIYELFKNLEEITPLMLQKLLYYVQGFFMVFYNRPMFVENCEAWIHGPVYPQVYFLFKKFRFNPIEDERFSLLAGKENNLTTEEKEVIQLVAKTFGIYGGKTLEKITHKEKPWCDARYGFTENMPSHTVIDKEEILDYFKTVNQTYDLTNEQGINDYIIDKIREDE